MSIRVHDTLTGLTFAPGWAILAEIREARAAYQSGDYVTIDEYIARRREKA